MGKLHFVRITTLVCDQKMERSFLSLKAAGSFKDCTFCTMPSIGCARGETDNDGDHCDTGERASPEEVYEMQTSPGAATLRDVTETISRKLLVARHVHKFSDANRGPPCDVLKSCKEFLAMNSVSTLLWLRTRTTCCYEYD